MTPDRCVCRACIHLRVLGLLAQGDKLHLLWHDNCRVETSLFSGFCLTTLPDPHGMATEVLHAFGFFFFSMQYQHGAPRVGTTRHLAQTSPHLANRVAQMCKHTTAFMGIGPCYNMRVQNPTLQTRVYISETSQHRRWRNRD